MAASLPLQDLAHLLSAPRELETRVAIHAFGPFELDGARFELRNDGAPVAIQPRVLDLLLFLVRRGPSTVSTRAELVRHVWGGVTVTKDAIAQAVRAARLALGDDDARPVYIETVRGRGYRFCAPVVTRIAPSHAPSRDAETSDLERAITAHLREALALLATLEQRRR